MRSRLIVHCTALTALILAPASQAQEQAAPEESRRPVMLAGGEDVDPCALGMIQDPPTGGETGAILVFAGPSSEFEVVDTLGDGNSVWVCDVVGDMLGIVYSHDPDWDCDIPNPEPETRPYFGPCASGWVKSEWVEVIAG
ncbi:hypothetical protein [Erythrobacter donghaensis]|uniref:hypothetical protein n=1 Tax=Erythrobacter donghaensis TaxID=267135 RepID=UPI000A397C38|nr:hypothetical protein [Erythrobacter donghaensis]